MANYLNDLAHSTEDFDNHEVLTVSIELIDTDNQVRTDFNDIESFATSILESGRIFNPLVVVRKGRRFLLNQGERRLRALRLLVEQGHEKFAQVPVSLVAFDSEKSAFLAQLGENLSRDDLTSLEIARSIEFYRDNLDNKTGWKSRFAKANGRDAAFVSRHLKILSLPDEIQNLVTQGLVNTPRHLIQLAEYTNYLDLVKRLENQEPFAQVIKAGKL
ncbi:MAG: ParB/RepB/Spo0J family partition protein, partial [Marinicella sp.]